MIIEDEYVKDLVWFTSAALSVCLVVTFITCICGCRKKIPKNELLGLAGLVKITNPDENVNFNASTPEIQLNSVTIATEEFPNDNNDPSKRGNNAVATATRSLPDLPVDLCEPTEKLWPLAENNTDTNSDLYATVEDANRKKRQLLSGLTVDSSYTPSQTDDSLSPYARLKGEHPYDQLEQNEHPYAQVGTNGNHGPGPSTSQDKTVNPTPSRAQEIEQDERKTPSESSGDDGNILAANAIAGSVPANHDLPYMTPPIPVPSQQPQHFSGDSVDSSKGYTSISVREPLSCILNETRNTNSCITSNSNGGNATQDPHYATVSDDSDEMYAAIEERQGGEYTSGSETYARITPRQALTLAIHHAHPPGSVTSAASSVPSTSHGHHHHPPHNRESASSISSSESPRRERRVANSPLPQVPSPTLDDMYAKVMKKGRSPTNPEPSSPSITMSLPPPSPILHPEDILLNVVDQLGGDTYESLDPVTDPNYEEVAGGIDGGLGGSGNSLLGGSAGGGGGSCSSGAAGTGNCEPDYASLSRKYEPPYERVSNASLHEDDTADQPDYEVVSSTGGPLTQIYSQIDKSPKAEYEEQ